MNALGTIYEITSIDFAAVIGRVVYLKYANNKSRAALMYAGIRMKACSDCEEKKKTIYSPFKR